MKCSKNLIIAALIAVSTLGVVTPVLCGQSASTYNSSPEEYVRQFISFYPVELKKELFESLPMSGRTTLILRNELRKNFPELMRSRISQQRITNSIVNGIREMFPVESSDDIKLNEVARFITTICES